MESLTRKQLRQLIENPYWQAMYHASAYLIDRWNMEQVKQHDEFSTLWGMAEREGRIKGVQELLETIELLATEDDK